MTDSRLRFLSTEINSPFDHYPFHRASATLREHSARIREWNQRQHGLFYDLGPGAWHAHTLRSWWQAPYFWRHECSSSQDPSFIISGILIRGSQWWSYRSLHQKDTLSVPQIVVTSHGWMQSSLVPLLIGMGGFSARANARLWPWIDFSPKHPAWKWATEAGMMNNQRVWHARALSSPQDVQSDRALHPSPLFRPGDAFECWVDSLNGFPVKFRGLGQNQSIWELTVEERCFNPEDIPEKIFMPHWLDTLKP